MKNKIANTYFLESILHSDSLSHTPAKFPLINADIHSFVNNAMNVINATPLN